MQLLEAPYLIKYNVTPTDEGVLLRVWEPAPMNQIRTRPFLYMANHRLLSEDEAQEILGCYLAAYQ